jgi:hypothetical protein
MRGWCPECPFSPIEITRNLRSVCKWRKMQTIKMSSEWQRPPRNEWKWNVDGSSRGKPGAACIGGVLRNDWRNIG